MMERGSIKIWSPELFFIRLLCLGAFLFTSTGEPGCPLDFSSYPYNPIGGCDHVQESLKDWIGFPKTRCCQNALIVFANALALGAKKDPSRNIFLRQDQWSSCSQPFRSQPNVSVQTCGFDNFFFRSGKCSSLQLYTTDQNVVTQCSNFGSVSFDVACENCTSAISSALDQMLDDMKIKGNSSEKALCLVRLIVTALAGIQNGTDDFNRCMPALVTPAPQKYIKVSRKQKLSFKSYSSYHSESQKSRFNPKSLEQGKKSLALVTSGSAVEALLTVASVMIVLTVVIAFIRCITRAQRKMKMPPVLHKGIPANCSGLYWFSKAEIEKAINYNDEKKCLGRGSAGQVYKGMLPSGQLVAIKQIYKSNTSDSFTREIEGLSRVRHPNLVYLFGCCVEDGEQYLVYEYCSKGNLAHHILRKDTALTWELRVKILRDCAFALKYLHNHIDGCIVHRDIKLTNILLIENMDPKLSDFGLAKMLGMEESKVYTDVRGTIGYMDPEYMSNAKLTSASDVYSFGIVILQLLSGQKVIEFDLDARDQLVRKAKDVNMGKRPLIDFQDPRMKGQIISVDFESILQIAVLCVASSSSGRPTIDLVFQELEKAWRNTQIEKRLEKEKEKSPLTTTPSKLQELIRV